MTDPSTPSANQLQPQEVSIPKPSAPMSKALPTADPITEGNKLIAEFMGADFNNEGDFCYFKLPDNKAHTVGGLKYHTSWDWLMPVVEKIEKDFVNSSTISHHRFEDTYWCEFIDSEETQTGYAKSETSKIEAVWLCVIDFIKYYNQNKQS